MSLKIKRIDSILEAIKKSEIESVKDYYSNLDINKPDRFNRTLLMNAILYGEMELAKWAISRHADVNHQDKKGLSALHIAVERNQSKLVSFILQNGVAVDLQDHYGNTALWRAMMDNVDIKIIYILFQYQANPDLRNHYGISARDLLNEENRNWELLHKIFNEVSPAN
ncbi:ankyrin repeat domain-containing protein [Sphingobacterium sp.]|uniref:ankyrin repeat domain-containing protein n=1 Tax=Sphingobacterium sp. TaxID=341027 RepID=UPI0028A7CC69|nr:ankyrin repeat domain-containing protein [Sphingobacterium sp.]